jgi:predicted methyltransferase
MMAVHDREELLRREAEAWAALLDAAERVPAELRTVPGVVPDWSVCDLVFHSGKWSELAGTHLEEMAAGTFVGDEQPEEVWQAMNSSWAEESKSLTWEQAVAAAEAGRMKARTALEALDEVDDTARSWFVDETFDHYPEHTEEIARFADGSS